MTLSPIGAGQLDPSPTYQAHLPKKSPPKRSTHHQSLTISFTLSRHIYQAVQNMHQLINDSKYYPLIDLSGNPLIGSVIRHFGMTNPIIHLITSRRVMRAYPHLQIYANQV
ncbi:MAG: hypothetical protein ABJQ29_02690 [Luteolibacter sp.]